MNDLFGEYSILKGKKDEKNIKYVTIKQRHRFSWEKHIQPSQNLHCSCTTHLRTQKSKINGKHDFSIS